MFATLAAVAAICIIPCSAGYAQAPASPQSPAAPKPSPQARSYSSPLDPWRACDHLLPEAKKCNPIALHACFLAAYVRVSDPYLGGEDLEMMYDCMQQLVQTLGDASFAQILAMERPEVQAAVGCFFDVRMLKGEWKDKGVKGAPKTLQLIQSAPHIDFPLSQSEKDEDHALLLQKFIRYEKKHHWNEYDMWK